MANLNKTCIICKEGFKIIKLSCPSSLTNKSNYHGNTVSRWKHLIAESFSMLFGLPVNHPFVSSFTENEEPLLCNQCLQDLNDVHFIFWQLHNLEAKLIKLQNVIFQRLNLSLEAQERTGNSYNLNDITTTLLNDINSGSHNLPTGVYISRWKDAVENVNKIFPNTSLSSHNLRNKIEIKVDPDPDLIVESSATLSPQTMDELLAENEDYFLDANVDNNDDDDDYEAGEIGNDNPEISEDDFDQDDYGDDEDYQEEVQKPKPRNRKKGIATKTSTIKYDNLTQDSNGNFVCTMDPDLCQRTFPSRNHLVKHFSDFHKGRDFACDQDECPQKFKSEITLINHKRKFHGLNIETSVKPRKRLIDPQDGKPGLLCTEDPSICNRMYERLKDLNKHISDFHKGRDYACDQDDCVQKFKSELRLSQHKKLVHKIGVEIKPPGATKKRGKYKKGKNSKDKADLPPSSNSSVCEVCGLTIPQKRMKKHFKANHLGYGRFKCDLCGMDFSNSEQVKCHEEFHTQNSSTFPFKCVGGEGAQCEEIFTNTIDLRTHVKMNHLSSGLKCEICGVMKPNKFVMQRHVREVHDPKRERSMVCEECGKSYFTAQGLKEHVNTAHLKEKIFCEVCGKGFYRKSALWHHKLGHQSVKPYGCSVCGKGFFNLQQMKKHEEIHAGIKKYECKMCGKRFKQMQNLRQHLRTQVHRPKGGNRGKEGGGGGEGLVGVEGEGEESVKYEDSLQDNISYVGV